MIVFYGAQNWGLVIRDLASSSKEKWVRDKYPRLFYVKPLLDGGAERDILIPKKWLWLANLPKFSKIDEVRKKFELRFCGGGVVAKTRLKSHKNALIWRDKTDKPPTGS